MEALCQLSYSPEAGANASGRTTASHPIRNVRGMKSGILPGERGSRSEVAVASALIRSGAHVYLPAFGVNGRIDLVYEPGAQLVRVQCKTAHPVGNTLRFSTCSNTRNVPVGYAGQVDEFGVFSPDTNLVYIVPVAAAPSAALDQMVAAQVMIGASR